MQSLASVEADGLLSGTLANEFHTHTQLSHKEKGRRCCTGGPQKLFPLKS
jgi:hypothetical protein